MVGDQVRRLLGWLLRDPFPVQSPGLRRAMRNARIRERIVDVVLERERREAMATTRHIDDEINAELRRIGAQPYAGETAIHAVAGDEYGAGNVRISDYVEADVFPAEAVLAALEDLPDDAGWQAAWDAIAATRPTNA